MPPSTLRLRQSRAASNADIAKELFVSATTGKTRGPRVAAVIFGAEAENRPT
jgi:hypothetical protein